MLPPSSLQRRALKGRTVNNNNTIEIDAGMLTNAEILETGTTVQVPGGSPYLPDFLHPLLAPGDARSLVPK